MKNSESEKFDKRFKLMFKFVFVFIIFVVCLILTGWGLIAYLAVSKGPETIQRVERVVDAYSDKLEQENKNQKNPE